MKNKNGTYIIGVDHGYGNIKTANCCFPTFKQDLLVYEGKYYQIGIGHKEYAGEKIMDEDYYVLTLAALARELAREQITPTAVFIAAGLHLSWVGSQKQSFRKYLLRNSEVEFTFRSRDYHIRIVGTEVFPQGFAAIAERLSDFSGTHLLCDIGNGTMNLLRIANRKPDPRNMFTEKYGVQQCVIAMQEALMREHKAQVDEETIHSFLRHGTAGTPGS